jgi:Zn-dependent peptidase ImmA (M78 family)
VIPEYRVWEIERKAADLLRTAYPDGLPPAYVEIEWVIEKCVGLEIVPIPSLRRGWDVDGMICCYSDGGYCIVVDEDLLDHKPSRYRFTLGEELGHHELHRDHLPKVTSFSEAIRLYRELGNWHEADRNARRFAAAALIPMPTLRVNAEALYAKLVRTAGLGDPEAIRKHLTGLLAKAYGVSAEAMRYRLAEYPERLDARVDKAIQENLDWLP